MQATVQLAGRSVVAGISRIKRFPEICSNFRTFLLSFYKMYGREISGIFLVEIFQKIYVIVPEISKL